MDDNSSDPIEELVKRERKALRYRKAGLSFYERYPNDARRWEWLGGTQQLRPRYYKDAGQGARASLAKRAADVELDQAGKEEWQRRYREELRPAVLASRQITPEQRFTILSSEVYGLIKEGDDRFARGEPVDVAGIEAAIMELGNLFPEERWAFRFPVEHLYSNWERWGMDFESRGRLFAVLKTSPNAQLREIGAGKERVYALRSRPLELQFTGFDGRTLDFAQWRGKVVLVDIWDTSCTTCIEEMPRIRKAYDRYRSQGFEVVGICMLRDDQKDRQRAAKILEQQGANWATGYLAREAGEEFMRKYGNTAVPVVWIFGRDGLLFDELFYAQDIGRAIEPKLSFKSAQR